MATVLMILLKIVHVIPQKSYVCESYITDKNPYMLVGDASPYPPLDPPLVKSLDFVEVYYRPYL